MKNLLLFILILFQACSSEEKTESSNIEIYIEIGTANRLIEQGYIQKNEVSPNLNKSQHLNGKISVKIGDKLVGEVDYSGLSIWVNPFLENGTTLLIDGFSEQTIYLGASSMNLEENQIIKVLKFERIGSGNIDYQLDLEPLIR